ncbi:hypothetical protein [Bradyrhizobium sp. USDA 4486]
MLRRAQIDFSPSAHGARDLRGRFATALSRDPEWRFTGGEQLDNHDGAARPWSDPQRKPDDTERTRLMGKAVGLKAKERSGPRPFACAKPRYKVTCYTHDMIFQTAFDEMQLCEIDVHSVDDTTAEVGLNNYVYTLKKL